MTVDDGFKFTQGIGSIKWGRTLMVASGNPRLRADPRSLICHLKRYILRSLRIAHSMVSMLIRGVYKDSMVLGNVTEPPAS